MTQPVSVYGVHFSAQGEILLVKDFHSHLWGFPGGGVEDGETHDDALRREFLEETGLHAIGDFHYLTQQTDASKQRFFYKVDETEGTLCAIGNASDIEQGAYFTPARLASLDLAPGLEAIVSIAQ